MQMTIGQFLSQSFASPRNLTDFSKVTEKFDNRPISHVEVDLKARKVILRIRDSQDSIEFPLQPENNRPAPATRGPGLEGAVGIGG